MVEWFGVSLVTNSSTDIKSCSQQDVGQAQTRIQSVRGWPNLRQRRWKDILHILYMYDI